MVPPILTLLLLTAVAAIQFPFSSPQFEEDGSHYQFSWPIQRVAVIGAGVGGLIAYRELKRPEFNYTVKIFERDDVPGGNWHYSEEQPKDAPVPNANPVVADYVPSFPPEHGQLPYEEAYHGPLAAEKWRDHRAPKPIWASLESNAPSPYQQIRELPWPEGTPWALPHATLRRYLRAFASWRGVNSNDNNPHISYNTRVETVTKRFVTEGDGSLKRQGWTLTLKKLIKTGPYSVKTTWWTEDFDAIVVASGRYNAPNIPVIKGLEEWKKRFPTTIHHSREYRRPKPFTDKTVLVVGAATSGAEIARDINKHAKKVYLSVRPENTSVVHFPISSTLARIPPNTTVIGEIETFLPFGANPGGLADGSIRLTNGTVVTGIDEIIFGTGFRYGFPFLSQFHDISLGPDDRAPEGKQQPLVTDGTHIRSLYLDAFYIEEPTIGFVNMNVGMQSFTYSEFLTTSFAKVWSGRAKLPSTAQMWDFHNKVIKERGGYSKYSLFLGTTRTRDLLRFFVAWLNDAAVRYGGRQIEPLPNQEAVLQLWSRARYGNDIFANGTYGTNSNSVLDSNSAFVNYDPVYDMVLADNW